MAHVLLLVHSALRWLVLLAGLVAVARLANGYSRRDTYGPLHARASRIFIGLVDLQFLLGLILYAVSPVTRGAMRDMAGSMQDPHVRFFIAEHPLMMFLALSVAHATSIWVRRTVPDRQKFLRGAMGFAFAMGLMIAGIPWWRLSGR